ISPFYPGPGVGGHCIPLDPHYLEWKAREYNFNTRFIALSGELNRQMPEFVVRKARRILGKNGVAIVNSRILLLGLAYKKDIADDRESPAVEVFKELLNEDAELSYHDPYISSYTIHGQAYQSIELNENSLDGFDLVIITTDHSNVDYDFVVKYSKLVFDTRYIFKGQYNKNKVILL
ncbi:MAG: UDP-N-acetyl-D-glucosamine dehydrogenase, partial [Bacteroidetes bacterium]|nr:UDP-N-acetyl-D-glucosamine dehydrogenase [Bacteroidota bacterium]